MTDAEIDALAREILAKTISTLQTWNGPRVMSDVESGNDGELFPTYEGTSEKGYGSFLVTYMPLAAVKKIIVECEKLHDTFTVEITDKQTGKTITFRPSEAETPASRENSIRIMIENATFHIIGMFAYQLWDSLEESVHDGLVIAKSSLVAVVTQFLKHQGLSDDPADVREYIEEAAKRVADKKREHLQSHIDGLPQLLAKRGQGAPPKSESQKRRERDAYIARVKDAYRNVRLREGKKPPKVRIATELRAGGVNPKKGSDTRLNAFGNKLRSLKIDYDAIVSEVEAELHD
jgi:hypothetical protein